MVPSGGACLLCHLPTLPLAYFLAPIPPPPFPAGRGRFLVFLCKGLRPLHPRGLGGARHWLGERWRFPAGGLPSWSPAYPAFSLFVCPHPPYPLPSGKGGFLVFLCKGLRPLHPRGWAGRGTGSTSVGGARRGACLFGRRLALPPRYPAGGVPSWSPAYPAFSLLSRPHPPDPLPSGKGETISLFCRGLRPRHPGIRPLTALTDTATMVPGGGVPSWSPAYPAFSLFVCPQPPTPLPSGKGEIFSFFLQGASPLASPGLGGARHWLG